MAKDVKFGEEARAKMLRGVDILAPPLAANFTAAGISKAPGTSIRSKDAPAASSARVAPSSSAAAIAS